MRNEKEFKTLFKKSVRACKGYSISLAAPMIVGIPDLYCIVHTYMPILLEAKFLGTIKKDKFSRKIPFTEPQKLWIEQCHSVTPYSAMGLIGFYYQDKLYACLVAHNTSMYNTITQEFLNECAHIDIGPNKLFNVAELFGKVPIPKIAKPVEPSISDPLDDLYDLGQHERALAPRD